jgi:hypothetical protein
MMERLSDLLALLCLASSGLLLFAGFKYYFFLSVVLVLSICVEPRAICYPLLQWSCRFGRFRPIAEGLIRILHTINVSLRLEPLLIGLTLAILTWGCEALAFNVLVQRVPVEIPFVASFAIVGLSRWSARYPCFRASSAGSRQ